MSEQEGQHLQRPRQEQAQHRHLAARLYGLRGDGERHTEGYSEREPNRTQILADPVKAERTLKIVPRLVTEPQGL